MSRIAPRLLLAAWELVKARGIDVFRPGAAAVLTGLSGWSALGLAASETGTEPSISLLDALRALALRERAVQGAMDRSTALVATLPLVERSMLSTADVATTLLESARNEILLVGFEIGEDLFCRTLVRRGMAGIAVTVVGDREKGAARRLLRSWPAAARPLRALENVEPASKMHGIMHGKVIVADASTALVGSANFTTGGLRGNMEFGLRVAGEVPREIVRLVRRLEHEGWLVPASP